MNGLLGHERVANAFCKTFWPNVLTVLQFVLCPMSMQFRVGAAKAKASASPFVAEAAEVSVAEITGGQIPLAPVSCRGRIHAIFAMQEPYPVCKHLGIVQFEGGAFISGGMKSVVALRSILVKLNAPPSQRLELDSMIMVLVYF